MAKKDTAPFAQNNKSATAVVTAAAGNIGTDSPTGTVLLLTAGEEGTLVTSITAIPRATTTANSLLLFTSSDGGTTKRLIDSELMTAYTLSTTTKIPKVEFSIALLESALKLAAGESLYVGAQVAQASGIVFCAKGMDY